jgi:hypothetical protein
MSARLVMMALLGLAPVRLARASAEKVSVIGSMMTWVQQTLK